MNPECPRCHQHHWHVEKRIDGTRCCDECANRRGLSFLGYPADRRSTVRQRQVWILDANGVLRRHELRQGAVRINVNGEWWPVWHVYSHKGGEAPPLVYSIERPSNDAVTRILQDMRDRWKDEPWFKRSADEGPPHVQPRLSEQSA